MSQLIYDYSIFYVSKFAKYRFITFFPMRGLISQTANRYFPAKHQIHIKFQQIASFVGQLIQFSLRKQTTSKAFLTHSLSNYSRPLIHCKNLTVRVFMLINCTLKVEWFFKQRRLGRPAGRPPSHAYCIAAVCRRYSPVCVQQPLVTWWVDEPCFLTDSQMSLWVKGQVIIKWSVVLS